MAAKTVFGRLTREAPSASRAGTRMLHVCCLCGLLQDETGPSLDQERWVTQRTFQKLHGVYPENCLLTHTYCPACFTQVMDRTREWHDR
jgi:hypothetical protein